jgi:hypothetical protein
MSLKGTTAIPHHTTQTKTTNRWAASSSSPCPGRSTTPNAPRGPCAAFASACGGSTQMRRSWSCPRFSPTVRDRELLACVRLNVHVVWPRAFVCAPIVPLTYIKPPAKTATRCNKEPHSFIRTQKHKTQRSTTATSPRASRGCWPSTTSPSGTSPTSRAWCVHSTKAAASARHSLCLSSVHVSLVCASVLLRFFLINAY